MGMVLEHELTDRCAAGSLGGTLGRLNESLRRLSRAHRTGSREQPGGEAETGFIEPARLALIDQTLRLMADAWPCGNAARPPFGHLEDQLDSLKEKALDFLWAERGRSAGHPSEYHLLALALDGLKTEDGRYGV